MKIDLQMNADLDTARAAARLAEELGLAGLFLAETKHDPLMQLVPLALETSTIDVGTGIAVAFARNPMCLANAAYDLQSYSRGRFVLGLGSQVAAHITRRYSMPWTQPAARMRELVLAVKAILTGWQDGTPLDVRGEFYTHTVMTPMFDPGPNPYGMARVFVAAVGPRMSEVAGEVADGVFIHAFTTREFLCERTMPSVARGLERSGRERSDFEVSFPLFIVTGRDEAEQARAADMVRAQLAFYGSTPAYRAVLEAHGWGDLHTELHQLSTRGGWDEMGSLFDDELLDAFAVVAEPGLVAGEVVRRYGGIVDRVNCALPGDVDGSLLREVLAGFDASR